MQTFRRSIARGPDNQPHKVKLVALTRELKFDNDAPVQADIPEVAYAVRLGITPDNKRIALLYGENDVFTVDDRGASLGRWSKMAFYGWAAIRQDRVLLQMPSTDGETSVVLTYDVFGNRIDAVAPIPVAYSSMGIIRFAPDGTPVTSTIATMTEVVDGISFSNYASDGRVTVGQVEAMRRGGIAVKIADLAMLMVQRTPTFDGYTNMYHEVLDMGPGQTPWIALQGSDKWSETPEPDAIELVPFKSMPEPEFLQPPRALHLCPGDLVWSVDIEGDHWAYELYQQGKPARVLFHDTRAALDAPIATITNPDGTTEIVTTLWLAKKTGACIWYYHDRNVDHEIDGERLPWLTALATAVTYKRTYAMYMGVNGYPRLQHGGATFGEDDAVYCIQKMLDDCATHELPAVLFLAIWGGNPVGDPPHLAYPEGVLARLFINLIVVLNAYHVVDAVVGFGEGRNDVSAWCVDFLRRWRLAMVGQLLPLMRTPQEILPVVRPPVDCVLGPKIFGEWTPAPHSMQETRAWRRDVVVAPANGGRDCEEMAGIETRTRVIPMRKPNGFWADLVKKLLASLKRGH